MAPKLNPAKTKIHDQDSLKITDFVKEAESEEYEASRFQLNGWHILSRTAKITPKKVGQFVTIWKRSQEGPIAPFNETDPIDFLFVNVRTANQWGQFIFPKSILIKKGILTTVKREGKRAFRVYPKWDITKSKQAARTQKWQLEYFYEMAPSPIASLPALVFQEELMKTDISYTRFLQTSFDKS